MSAFDRIPRPRVDPPDQDETAFAYLNASGRIEAERVRKLVDEWFEHYPADRRDALLGRFRSPIDDQHLSAFFELFLHELALARGHEILAIEPALADTSKSPDFLIESQGHRFYLEAVMASGRSRARAAAEARLNQALTAIDRTPSCAHFLEIMVNGLPSEPISIGKLKGKLQKWIAGLPDDDRASEAAPFIYAEHGVTIRVFGWPRYNREKTERAIGVRHFRAKSVKVYDDIRAAIEKKARRYGALDYPYVIAVHTPEFFADDENALVALLGTRCLAVCGLADESEQVSESRNHDGIWNGPRGPRKRGLSAVFVARNVDPWNFAARNGCLIRNPWADPVLPAVELGTDELNPVGGEFLRIEGQIFGSLFSLPKGWPGD